MMIHELEHALRVTLTLDQRKTRNKKTGRRVPGNWQIIARDPLRDPDRERVYHTLGTKDGRLALTIFQEVERLVRAGELDLWEEGVVLPTGRAVTCVAAVGEYLEHLRTRPSPSGRPIREPTRYQYACVLNGFASWLEAKLHAGALLRDLKPQHAEAFVFGRELEASTMGTQLNRLRAFLDWCVKRRYVRVNPAAELKAPPAEGRTEYLTRGQYEALLGCIDKRYREHRRELSDWGLPALSNAIVLGCEAGLRCGEICALPWSDIDLTPGKERIHVVSSAVRRTKSGRSRTVPIAGRLVRILHELRASAPPDAVYVLQGPNGCPVRENYLSQQFKVFVKRAGLPDRLRFHSTRHTYCTWLAEAGTPEFALGSVSGHGSGEMVRRYAHTSAEAARVYVDRAFA